ncbi:MAG: ABC transporter ATP-binding protein [Bauldia sp.]
MSTPSSFPAAVARPGGQLRETAISVRGLTVGFGAVNVLQNLDLDVYRSELLGVVGASGSGKSVLLHAILGLVPRRAGSIEVLGVDLEKAGPESRAAVGRRLGVLFQHGALFSSLTVQQNVELPMREHLDLSDSMMADLARLKIDLVGLPAGTAAKYPSELSGGMTKRAGLARALALDPEILFLDEPTSGLDPVSAGKLDELIATLRATLDLTVFMVSHDLDSLQTLCDRIAVIGDKRILVEGSLETILASEHAWVKEYFHGPRAHLARPTG